MTMRPPLGRNHPNLLGSGIALLPVVEDRVIRDMQRACYRPGTDLGEFRRSLMGSLRRAVPFDVAFFATVDPDSLLFTSTFAEEPLAAVAPLFLDNEFGVIPDVNRFAEIAVATAPVGSLDQATAGERSLSARSREILGPLGLGDEARMAFRVDGISWGFMCLHRSGPTGFSAQELAVMAKLAPHAGEALRRLSGAAPDLTADGPPQAVILTAEGIVMAVGGAVEQVGCGPIVVGNPLPLLFAALVRRLEAIEGGVAKAPPATVRIRTPTGDLMAVHATRLYGHSGSPPVVITLSPATPAERSSLLLATFGLTAAQQRVANLVLQGRTTRQIMMELHITAHTVQDHLKAVFDKTDVRSRRDLVNLLMRNPR
jgi:DNA-binding CsgD family transcriptional regulator